MKLVAYDIRVILEPVDLPQQTNIALPDSMKMTGMIRMGRVVSVGPNFATAAAINKCRELAVGDVVLYNQPSVQFEFENRKLICINNDHVVAFVED